MKYTVVMKFRGRYEAIRIEEDSAAKAAFSAAKSAYFYKSIFVGCFTDDEMSHYIQEHADKSTTRNRLSMLIEERTSDCFNTNTIQLSSINGDIKCEKDILQHIFRFIRSRRVIRIIIGETLPTIKFEAYDCDGYDAHIHMTI